MIAQCYLKWYQREKKQVFVPTRKGKSFQMSHKSPELKVLKRFNLESLCMRIENKKKNILIHECCHATMMAPLCSLPILAASSWCSLPSFCYSAEWCKNGRISRIGHFWFFPHNVTVLFSIFRCHLWSKSR